VCFTQPLRCGSQVARRGQRVGFRIRRDVCARRAEEEDGRGEGVEVSGRPAEEGGAGCEEGGGRDGGSERCEGGRVCLSGLVVFVGCRVVVGGFGEEPVHDWVVEGGGSDAVFAHPAFCQGEHCGQTASDQLAADADAGDFSLRLATSRGGCEVAGFTGELLLHPVVG